MNRIAWYTTLVLLTISGLVLLWNFREAAVLFLLSLAISAAFHPLIDQLTERKIPRNAALIVSYGVIFLAIAGLLYLMGGPLIRDVEQISNQIAVAYGRLHADWLVNETPFLRSLAESVPRPEDLFVEMVEDGGIQLFNGLMNFTTDLAALLRTLGFVVILSLYWSADRLHFERLLLSLIAVDQRPQVRSIWRGIEKGVGAYIRSEFLQSLIAGLLLWLGYRLMGLDYPVLLAVLGGLAWLIPWFGAILAMIPPFIVGFAASPALGIIAALYTLAILIVQEYLIEPKIFRRNSYSAVILVLVILALVDAFGFVGLLLAPLLSATIQNIIKYLLPTTNAPEADKLPADAAGASAGSFRERLAQTKSSLRDFDPPHAPEIDSLVERLDLLILETELYSESQREVPQAIVSPRKLANR